MAMNKDLTGQKFGHLSVVKRNGSKNNRAMWECKCDCRNQTIVDTHSLTSQNTKSCGCQKHGGRRSHGEASSHSRLYRILAAMKSRCVNPKNISFSAYGGKGIQVCAEWLKFEPFRDWARENGYTDSLTIDRIDINGNYEPGNCRWSTYKVQSNNTSRNHYITAFGETMTISQWADRFGVSDRTIAARINLLGWDAESAVSKPVRGGRHE